MMDCVCTHDIGGPVKSIDMHDDIILIGLASGELKMAQFENDSINVDGVVTKGEDQDIVLGSIMSSHNEGEVWGLTQGPDGTIISTGDDNKCITWDYN